MAIKVTNYLKNLGKSIAYAGVDQLRKNTYLGKTVLNESNRSTFKSVYDDVRNIRSTIKRVNTAIKSSNIYQVADYGYKSALEDLKTGNFYNTARGEKLLEGDFDFDDDFDFDSGDGDDNFDFDDSPSDSAKIAKAVEASTEASTNAIAGAIVKSAKYNADVAKESNTFMIMQQTKLFGDLKTSILGVDSAIGQINQFNQGAMTTHIENSRKYFEETTKYQRENNAILKEILDMQRIQFKDYTDAKERREKRKSSPDSKAYGLYDSEGVLNFKGYLDTVKKNFKDTFIDGTGLSMLTEMDNESLPMFKEMASNPLGALLTYGMSRALGKNVNKSFKNIDKTMQNIIPNLFAELELAKGKSGLTGFLADLFSPGITDKKKLDTSNYEKGKVDFDGKTRKSILEVIPTYLSQITAALTNTNPVIYDFDSGRWTTKAEIARRFGADKRQRIESATSELRNSAKSALKGSNLSNDDRRKFVDKLSYYAYKNNSLTGIEDKLSPAELKLYNELVSKKIDKRTIAASVISSKKSHSDNMVAQEADGDSKLNTLFNNSQIFSNGKKSKSGNPDNENNFLLKGIYNELFLIRNGISLGVTGEINTDSDLLKSIGYNGKNIITERDRELKKMAEEARKKRKEDRDEARKNDNNKYSDKNVDTVEETNFAQGDSLNAKQVREVAKGIKEGGLKGFINSVKWIAQNPRNFMAGSLDIADKALYSFFFEHKSMTADGKPINGFFEHFSYKMEETFKTVRDYITERVFAPAKQWFSKMFTKGKDYVKDFAASSGINNFFSKVKGEVKSHLGGHLKSAENTAGEIKDNIKAKTSNLFNKAVSIDSNAYGSRYVESDGITTISKGEAIISADDNPLNPAKNTSSKRNDLAREQEILEKSGLGEGVMMNADGRLGFVNMSGKEAGEKAKEKLIGWVDRLKTTLGVYATDKLGQDKQSAITRELNNLFGRDKYKTAAKGAIGGGLGGIVGGMLLGPVGMMAGALGGGVINILKDSEVAKNFLLGSKDEKGNRTGGVISKGMQDKFKRFMPDFKKIGVPAALASSLLLGFGPLGAAVVGGGSMMLKNSTAAQELLFGKDTFDPKTGKTVKKGGLFGSAVRKHFKKNLPTIGAAALGTVMFGPFGGLLPNMLLGTGVGMLGTTETFKDLVLGKKDPRDPEGKKRIGGIVGGLKDYFITPISGFAKKVASNGWDILKEGLITPLQKTAGVIGRGLVAGAKDLKFLLSNGIRRAFETAVGTPFFAKLNEYVLDPLKKKVNQFLFTPLKWVGTGIKKVVTAPGRMVSGMMDRISARQIGSGIAAGGRTAAERLTYMGDAGYNDYARKEFDMRLMNASDDELRKLYEASGMLSDKRFGIRAYKDARGEASQELSKFFRGKENKLIKRIGKDFADGTVDDDKIKSYLDSISMNQNMTDKDKETLTKLINKHAKNINSARDTMNASEERLDNAKKLMESYGISDYDSSSSLDNDRLNRLLNDELVARNKKGYEEMVAEASKKEEERMANATEESVGLLRSIYEAIKIKFGLKGEVPKYGASPKLISTEKHSASEITIGADGKEYKKAMDGSLSLVGSESNSDKTEDEKAKDAKEDARFDKLGNIIGSKGTKVEEKKDKNGFLSKILGGLGGLGKGLLGSMGIGAGGIGAALTSMLGRGALVAGTVAALPTIIETIPKVTQWMSENKEIVQQAIDGMVKSGLEFGKYAITTLLDSIGQSFANGEFTNGFLQIIAAFLMGNFATGGLLGKLGGLGLKGLGKGAGKIFNKIRGPKTPGGTPKLPGGKGGPKMPKIRGGKLGALIGLGSAALSFAPSLFGDDEAQAKETQAAIESGNYSIKTAYDENGQVLGEYPVPEGGGETATAQMESSGGFFENALTAAEYGFMGHSLFNMFSNSNSSSSTVPMTAPGSRMPKWITNNPITRASSRVTSAVGSKVTALKDMGGVAMNKIGELTSKGASKVGEFSQKAVVWIKDLIVSGMSKLGSYSDKIGKLGKAGYTALAEKVTSAIVKSGAKSLGKLAAKVAIACTGVGTIALLVAQVFFAAKSIIYDGYLKWYNTAGVLYNEDLGDEVKWACVAAGVIDTLLFNILGIDVIAPIVLSAFGIDLTEAQGRAQVAIEKYNEDKESHPKGAPDRIETIQEYNDLFEKGILDKVGDAADSLLQFGKSSVSKAVQMAKDISQSIGDKSTAAKKWMKNNIDWLKNTSSNWFKGATTTAGGYIDRAAKAVKNEIDFISNTWDKAKDKAKELATDAYNYVTGNNPTTTGNPSYSMKDDSLSASKGDGTKPYTIDNVKYLMENGYSFEAAKKYLRDNGYQDPIQQMQNPYPNGAPKKDGKGKFGRGRKIFGRSTGSYFKQTDPAYANIAFNTSSDTIPQTIGDSACGPVAAVNAMSALGRGSTGYDPVLQASGYALSKGFKGQDTGTDPRFFDSYGKSQGYNVSSVSNSGVKSALMSGSSVVLEGEDPRGESSKHPFGSYPHYVTATGYNSSTGTVTIQDPESPYDNSVYKIDDILRKTKLAKSFSLGTPSGMGKRYARSRYKFGISKGTNQYTVRFGRGGRKRFGRGGVNVPELVWNFLAGKGIGSIVIAGIMGNMYAESRYQPNANQLDNEPNMNPYEAGYGLCQWTETRKDALQAKANAMGSTMDDPNVQLEYLWDEIKPGGPEASAFDPLGYTAQASDVADATRRWFDKFERGNPEWAHMDVRIAAAEDAFQKQGKGIVTENYVSGGGGNTGTSGGNSGPTGIFDKLFDSGPFKTLKDTYSKVFGSLVGDSGTQQQKPGSNPGGSRQPFKGNLKGKEGYLKEGGSMYGFDDDVLTWTESAPGATNIKDVQPQVKAKMNGIARDYFAATGGNGGNGKMIITGGAEGAEYGHDATSEFSHPAGWKIDIGFTLSDENEFIKQLQEYNVAAGKEGDHYDLGFGANNTGGYALTTMATSKYGPRFARAKSPNGNKFKPLKPKPGRTTSQDIRNLKVDLPPAKFEIEKDSRGLVKDTKLRKHLTRTGEGKNGPVYGRGGFDKVLEFIGNKFGDMIPKDLLGGVSTSTAPINPTVNATTNTTQNITTGSANTDTLLAEAIALLKVIVANTSNMVNVSKETSVAMSNSVTNIGKAMMISNKNISDSMMQMQINQATLANNNAASINTTLQELASI